MKVFISWSGEKSRAVAEIFKKWIPCIIQSAEPYFSSADIDKGARWSTDIAKELQDANFGILCVTKDNLDSPWLNFEAGALSKSMEQSKVCPLLIDLKPAEIQNSPILQFQMTTVNREDMYKLFKSINANSGEARLADSVLDTSFGMFWVKIEEELKSVTSSDSENNPKKASDSWKAAIEEILELTRYQHKLLNSPQEILPPAYLAGILTETNNGISKELLPEIGYHVSRIKYTADKVLRDSKSGDVPELFAPYAEALNEIKDRAQHVEVMMHRKMIQMRRMYRE